MKKKCAIYVRVSTIDKQDYKRQINECTKAALLRGFAETDIEIFADKVSGYKKDTDRPAMNELLEKIDTSPKYFSLVVVLEISRVGRTGKIIRNIIDRLKEHKIPLFIKNLGLETLDTNGKESITTNIIVAVFSEIADEYARSFKANSISGLRQAASMGKAGGGNNIATGYMKDDNGMQVINQEEVPVVKEIFKLYQAGNGIKVIANILNDKKIPTRMNKTHKGRTIKFNVEKAGDKVLWSDKTVHDILKNPLYKGDRRFKQEILQAPAIISKELWDECADIMKGKTHRNYLTTYTYLLKDRMTCNICGRNYFAKYKPVAGGDKVYICSSRLGRKGSCGNVGVNISLLESAIFHELVNSDLILKYLSNTKNIKVDLQRSVETLQRSVGMDDKSLNSKQREKERLLDVFLGTHITQTQFINKQASLDVEITTLRDKIELANKEIAGKQKALKAMEDNKANKRMLMDAAYNRSELQTIFQQFIKIVKISPFEGGVLASVYVNINGNDVDGCLRLFLNISGVRMKPARYEYAGFYDTSNHADGDTLEETFANIEWLNIPDKLVLSVE